MKKIVSALLLFPLASFNTSSPSPFEGDWKQRTWFKDAHWWYYNYVEEGGVGYFYNYLDRSVYKSVGDGAFVHIHYPTKTIYLYMMEKVIL